VILTGRSFFLGTYVSTSKVWPLWNIANDHGYVPLVVNTSRSFPHLWLIAGFVTRLTRRVSLVEQELLTPPEHMSSLPVFSGVRVTRSLVLCVCFVDRCLSFCPFSSGHCVVCSSSIYWFWLPLQTLLAHIFSILCCVFCFRLPAVSKLCPILFVWLSMEIIEVDRLMKEPLLVCETNC
jgi:hypothetical protein